MQSHTVKLLAIAAVILALGTWFFTRNSTPPNALAIVPARWTFLDPAGLDPSDEPLAEAIASSVSARGKLPLVPWNRILPFRQSPQRSPEIARQTGATRVLAVAVKQSRVTLFVAEPFTGRKLWAEDVYSPDLHSPDAVRTLAQSIAKDLEAALGAQ
jgi:hypothetical protein